MKRLHLIEIEDQEWCPRVIRDALTDYLQFNLTRMQPYAPMTSILCTALERTGSRQIVDLCSGGGGPWLWLHPVLMRKGLSTSVCLTDKYPNLEAFEEWSRTTDRAIGFHAGPVDATRVPGELEGFRTMFTAFHHFKPEQASAVLADAVRHRRSIGVFEATHRSVLALRLMLSTPFVVLLCTPFIRPFRWSRLFWTYLVPVLPLVILFDGLVSCLRSYSVQELRELTERLKTNDYNWDIGTVQSKWIPIPVTYLVGMPNTD
ncbi:MAG TPA: class I SAM-dependent methyltransferase [Verrucomicrobiae bacterium]|nr:class I SAM-dependent methyltransferase [Verrucomicrobiae bacterium]